MDMAAGVRRWRERQQSTQSLRIDSILNSQSFRQSDRRWLFSDDPEGWMIRALGAGPAVCPTTEEAQEAGRAPTVGRKVQSAATTHRRAWATSILVLRFQDGMPPLDGWSNRLDPLGAGQGTT
jgi:hypothetical protein